MKVGVLGATGYVGGRLVPELLAAGHSVRCLARSPHRLDRLPWRADVTVVQADVTDPATLEESFAGLDAVYYLVHTMGLSNDFEQTDRRGAENTRAASEAAGVGRLVYLGGLGRDSGDLSPHLASRHEVGRILASGPVPVTELRAAVIIGSGSASFEMLRHLDEVLPVMICPRWVTRTRCQPIAIADVLHYLVAVLGVPDTEGRILEVGGPDVLTYKKMMDAYADAAGLRRRVVVPVPLLTPRLSSHWVNLMTPLPYGLAKPLVDSLINDVVVGADRDIRRLIDHEPMNLDTALRRALARIKDLDVSTSWMDSAPAHGPAHPDPQDPDWAGGTMLENVQEVTTDASPEAVFAAIEGIGGDRGWYATPLWVLRGWLDEFVGGVGMRRGRRHPDHLRLGDALDFFRVDAIDPPRLLRLRAEMRVPGAAWLEWRVETDGATGRTVLLQLARFHPRGIAGRVYWWLLLPPHVVIFRQLARLLVSRAEAASSARVRTAPAESSVR